MQTTREKMMKLLSNVGKYVVIRQDNQGIVIATRKRFALAVSLDFSIK